MNQPQSRITSPSPVLSGPLQLRLSTCLLLVADAGLLLHYFMTLDWAFVRMLHLGTVPAVAMAAVAVLFERSERRRITKPSKAQPSAARGFVTVLLITVAYIPLLYACFVCKPSAYVPEESYARRTGPRRYSSRVEHVSGAYLNREEEDFWKGVGYVGISCWLAFALHSSNVLLYARRGQGRQP